jgi:putative ABC transport system permease protein
MPPATLTLPRPGRFDELVQDLRFGCRVLLKNPRFTLLASLTLALGIGANTAVFSLVNGVLVAPLPYQNPEQLIGVDGTYPVGGLVAMRDELRTMDVAASSDGHEFNLTGWGEATRLTGARVSAELFSVLGVQPIAGRVFHTGEDRAGNSSFVLLSYALWEQRFGREPTIVGRVIQLDGIGRQVVGVMPPGFRLGSSMTQLWIPFNADPRNPAAYWAGDFMPVIGRLRPGVTLQQANDDIRAFQARVRNLFPWRMPENWNADVNVVTLQAASVGDIRGRMILLLGAVGLILLIACANVANLTLARATTRQQEFAIRSALGAGVGRLSRQLLTESVLLAGVGGIAGVVLSRYGLTLLKAALPAHTPRLAEVQVDVDALLFASAVTILTGILFGLAPALQAARSAGFDSLRAGSRAGTTGSPRLRNSLVVAEVALAVLLVSAAGLLVRSFWKLANASPGFRGEQLITARITPSDEFCADARRCLAFYQQVLDSIQASPGISGVALVNTPPLGGRVAKRSFDVEGFTAPPSEAAPLFWLNTVTPDYFRVMGIPLLAGRGISDSDRSGGPLVAVVSAATARRYWPGQDAVGKRIRIVNTAEWFTVVGVVDEVRAFDLQRHVPEWIDGTVYSPYSPRITMENGLVPAAMTLVVWTAADQSAVEATIRRVVSGANRDVPVGEITTMGARKLEAAATPASIAVLFVVFAALALALGIVGIYGVLSYLVSKRTHEIGVRLALGADYHHVLWLMLREGLKLSAAGIGLGILGAVLASRLLTSELYGISPLDPFTYVTVTLGMTVATFLACWIPTRRATRVDPLVTLRQS